MGFVFHPDDGPMVIDAFLSFGLRGQRVGPVRDGQGVECFYNDAVTPAIRITPDLQHVAPSLRLEEPALIAGVRAVVSF